MRDGENCIMKDLTVVVVWFLESYNNMVSTGASKDLAASVFRVKNKI
jgi:hypothetical protein